jgi:hypothetical protein
MQSSVKSQYFSKNHLRTRGTVEDPVHFLVVLLTLLFNSPDNCRPTLTLCALIRRNSPIPTTALESPRPHFSLSSGAWGTKSKAFEKSIIIASTYLRYPAMS